MLEQQLNKKLAQSEKVMAELAKLAELETPENRDDLQVRERGGGGGEGERACLRTCALVAVTYTFAAFDEDSNDERSAKAARG
jgi:hypothetical protein